MALNTLLLLASLGAAFPIGPDPKEDPSCLSTSCGVVGDEFDFQALTGGKSDEILNKTPAQCGAICEADPSCLLFAIDNANGACKTYALPPFFVVIARSNGPYTFSSRCCIPSKSANNICGAQGSPTGKASLSTHQVTPDLGSCQTLCAGSSSCIGVFWEPGYLGQSADVYGDCYLSMNPSKYSFRSDSGSTKTYFDKGCPSFAGGLDVPAGSPNSTLPIPGSNNSTLGEGNTPLAGGNSTLGGDNSPAGGANSTVGMPIVGGDNSTGTPPEFSNSTAQSFDGDNSTLDPETGALIDSSDVNSTPGTDAAANSDGTAATPDGSQGTAPDGPQQTTPDGSQATTPDGSQATTPDGSQATAPDGSQATTPDGSQATAPDGSQATTPDGSQATTPDSSQQATTPDGSQQATTPDGSQQATTPDGSQATTPDGSQATTPDGSQQASTPDGSQATTPDGSQQATTPDGSQQATSPDGSQATTPDGSQQATTPDGSQQATTPDGSQQVTPESAV